MKVVQKFLRNSLRNFNYLVYSEITAQAIVFDPYDIEILDKECSARNLTADILLNTHYHPDHIRDNERFLKRNHTKKLELKDKEELRLTESEKVICRNTPGHVDGHKCFFLYEDNKLNGVICGDSVFNAGVGNCKNGGNPIELYESIRDIFYPLPDDVLIYPSHDYFLTNLKFAKTVDEKNHHIDDMIKEVARDRDVDHFSITTIGEEKKYNPFFRCFDKDFQKQHQKDEKELFLYLRSLRDIW